MRYFLFLFIVLIINVYSLSYKIEIFQNNNSPIYASAIVAAFTPIDVANISQVQTYYVESACKKESLPIFSVENRVVVTKRNDACSFVQRTLNVQEAGGKGLVIIHNEDYEGYMIVMLDDFSKSKREKVKIPTLMITKRDGRIFMRNDTENIQVSIPQDLERNIQETWSSYIWVFTVVYLGLTFCSGFFLFTSWKSKEKPIVKTMLLMSLVSSFCCRGILPLGIINLFYHIPIVLGYVSASIIAIMWVQVLKSKRQDERFKERMALIACSIIAIDLVRLIMIFSGLSWFHSYIFWSSIASALSIFLTILTSLSGYRLRRAILKFRSLESGSRRRTKIIKFTVVIFLFTFGLAFVALLTILYLIVPNIFGRWTWLVFNIYFKTSLTLYPIIIFILFGTFSTKPRDSTSSIILTSSNNSVG